MIAAMRMTTFWNAIEDLNGAAWSQREWTEILGDEWAPAATLLRPTDKKAEDLVCRRGCVDGCMRRVVPLIDGRLRAECGNPSPICDSVFLDEAEVNILALDPQKLAKALHNALSLIGEAEKPRLARAAFLGRYEISPGRGFPVFLYLPQPMFSPLIDGLDSVADSPPSPRLVLVPSRRSLTLAEVQRLKAQQATSMALEDILLWQARKGFQISAEPSILFAGLIDGIIGLEKIRKPSITVPTGTTWEDIELDLSNAQQFTATILGRTRIIVPHDLDMVKGPLNKPTLQWTLLEQFAHARGRLAIGASSAQRQKQKLVEKLNAAFGLHDEPFDIEGGCYVSRFKISADGLAAAAKRKRRTS